MLYKMRFIVCLFVFTVILPFCGCKKHTNKPANPVDQLPAATQTGANTFGCLVNGEVVVIHQPFGDLTIDFGSQYMLTYPSTNSFIYGVSGTDKVDDCQLKSVGLQLDSTQLQEGEKYPLNASRVKYGKVGWVNIANSCASSPFLMYTTDSSLSGQLTITHFDQQQIVSGTFYFDAVEMTRGDTVHVTNGASTCIILIDFLSPYKINNPAESTVTSLPVLLCHYSGCASYLATRHHFFHLSILFV